MLCVLHVPVFVFVSPILLKPIQSSPDAVDAAPLVVPSAEKIDLDHLLRDLQKYKPWLSVSAWEAWEQFMSTSSELSQLSVHPAHWMLPTLVSAAITASYARAQLQPESISTETTQLLAKETAVPAKVIYACLYCTSIWIYVIILYNIDYSKAQKWT